jgi:lipopolysaccharide/colanic/teichoic acid biosynthesis glycosyltransferase
VQGAGRAGGSSLVGPRPLVPPEDKLVEGWSRTRLDLMPGITGLRQVRGGAEIPFEEMVKLDYLYVVNWSLWDDLRLLLRTLAAVIGGQVRELAREASEHIDRTSSLIGTG